MEPRELLEALVDVVATLGELAATVAGPDGDVLLAVSPRSLHTALETFIDHLQDTLSHPSVTSLGRALAAFRANQGATWAHVTSAASAWGGSVATVEDSWAHLAREAAKLRDACRDMVTAEDTSSDLAGDLQDKAARWERSLHSLRAEAWQLPLLALAKEKMASAEAEHEARVVAAAKEEEATTKAKEDVTVATSKMGAAIKRRQKAEAALGLLERLVAACDKATAFPRELQRQLRAIEATLEGTNQASHDVPEALVAMVANAELLWEGSARLATRHLVGTLGDIKRLLSTRPGGPGGPSPHEVARQCQKAIKDIPRLLREQ